MTDSEMIKNRILVFYEDSTFIHLDLHNGMFYNGTVKDVKKDFFFFYDMKIGKIPIFFDDIKVLELYNKPEVIDDGK